MEPIQRSGKTQGKLYGVGLGPGDPQLLTLQAVRVLREVEVIFHVVGPRSESSVSGHIVDSVEGCRAERVELLFSMAADQSKRTADWERNADRVVRELSAGRNSAFVTIGDPLLYSTYTYLLREVRKRLPALDVTTVPGITAFQAAAARANLPLVEDDEVLTVVPAWKEELATQQATGRPGTTVFLKTYRHRNRIIEQVQAGGRPSTVLYAARVGLEAERIVVGVDEAKALPDEYLSLLIVKTPPASSALPPPTSHLTPSTSHLPPPTSSLPPSPQWNLSPEAIEQESFRRIEAEVGPHPFKPAEWRVVRRLIHTSANFGLVPYIRFQGDPVAAGLAALRAGALIYCDSQMIRNGLSLARLQKINPAYSAARVVCRVDDPAVAEEARRRGQTRALVAVERSRPLLDGAIILIGNAPLALASIARLIETDNLRPALVIGMPVGFVNVIESKEMLMRLETPQIVLEGRMGGSPLAVAALHAITESAETGQDA
ncbi:MAG: precorrin-2 C(20)-methyltransferase [bacterium]